MRGGLKKEKRGWPACTKLKNSRHSRRASTAVQVAEADEHKSETRDLLLEKELSEKERVRDFGQVILSRATKSGKKDGGERKGRAGRGRHGIEGFITRWGNKKRTTSVIPQHKVRILAKHEKDRPLSLIETGTEKA